MNDFGELEINEGWVHTWDGLDTNEAHDCTTGVCIGDTHGCAVWGTPFGTSCIWAPRYDGDPKPYADYAIEGGGNRFTPEQIHPGGVIPLVDGIQFAH